MRPITGKPIAERTKKMIQWLSEGRGLLTVYLLPPVLLILFIGVLYLPVLLNLDLPTAVSGAQVVFLSVVLRLFEASALVCGLAGVALNLNQLVKMKKMLRSVLLVLLALGYIAVGGWFVQLMTLFEV